ncbi:hypothetical protein A1O1_08598 [Capronia coronata CBS 617.96]|uniref:3-oxoacyl-[acyl-carrier protein] reductase n=1 Tax=Capronia coronata CBS 617.96 TaxID=1182541 RepID=W9XJU0_9EURO|nr:uncharacterized protein A1O1_08598 [Capronia coronata CBS 617.96]EXJ80453.1 hypothetical protein A1O1_08598 [Capronia coronata CBS 617.96]
MSNFNGQVVLITGAASGIGRATALRMAKVGANLALSDINPASLDETRQQCESVSKKSTQQHMASRVDVQSTESINDFVQSVVSRYGTIHHVFNCAGINPTKLEIEQITDAYWHKLMDTNVKSIMTMTRACVPHMSRGASFVNVSSMCGIYPTALFSVYCATKFAVIGFSKCMALELGARGIRVNVVAPGSIDTPTNASVLAGGDRLQQMAEGVGLKRAGTAEEVADVVAFLFSDESRYVNGSVVQIDGGLGLPG